MPIPTQRALRGARQQGGFALLVIISLIVLLSTYLLVTQLNASAGLTVDRSNRNSRVLNQAKEALIGYVAQLAAEAGQNNPGRLPCPEADNSINTSSEGVSAPQIALTGPPPVPATPACSLVGRLPWRTLGLDKLLDAASEPLWYVVSPGWTLQNSSTLLVINSSTQGQLVVDGLPAPNEVVALIIAPGPAMNVLAAAGCTARVQSRNAPTPGIDPRDYIECFNSGTSTFSTTGPSTSFNDQVLRVTTADLMPGIEAAIAKRIEREIVPELNKVYADTIWGSGITPTNPLYPYPAPFGNPSTSNYQGSASASQGLLPLSHQKAGCNPVADARCAPTFVSASGTPDAIKIGGWGDIQSKTCSWQPGGYVAYCEGEYREDDDNPGNPGMVISMTARISNVAMSLRRVDLANIVVSIQAENNNASGQPMQIVPVSGPTYNFNSDGSLSITISGTLPNIDLMGWDAYALYRMSIDRRMIVDHGLLDPDYCPVTGCIAWFWRNQWYRHLYYAPAAGYTAAVRPAAPSCSANCLTVAKITPPSLPGGKRAILILMGRRLTGAAMSANPADYLEFSNADGNTIFEHRPVSRAPGALFNDRVIVVGANP